MQYFLSSTFRFLAIIPVLFVMFSFSIQTLVVSAQSPDERAENKSATTKIDSVTIENQIGADTIQELLYMILNIIMILMVPVIVFFIIYAGFKYVMAQGNASQVEEATRALTYAIIGGVLILGAVAISQIIKSVVDAF